MPLSEESLRQRLQLVVVSEGHRSIIRRYLLSVTDNARNMIRMGSVPFGASDVLLLGIDAACLADGGFGAFPRQQWAVQVLAEQLLRELPVNSATATAMRWFWAPGRGVTTYRVAQVTDCLAANGRLVPTGRGSVARWTIPPERLDVTSLRQRLTVREAEGIDAAAQRALAIAVAWSKARRASADSSVRT